MLDVLRLITVILAASTCAFLTVLLLALPVIAAACILRLLARLLRRAARRMGCEECRS